MPSTRTYSSNPTMRVQSFTPSSFNRQSIPAGETAGISLLEGSPIGLLLALAYNTNITVPGTAPEKLKLTTRIM